LDSGSTITVVSLGLAVLGFFALHAAETALPLLRRSHLREMLTGRGAKDAAVRNLRASRSAYEDLIHILRLTSIAVTFSLAFAVLWVQRGVDWPIGVLGLVALWAALVLLRPLGVKLVEGLSDAALLRAGVLLQLMLWPGLPLARFSYRTMQTGRRAAEAASGNGVSLAEQGKEVEASVEEEIAEEPLEPDERRMIHAILHLEDTAVREIMVPRVDVVAIDVALPLEQAIDLILDSGHSRVPVYEDTLDNVLGVLYSRDLLKVTSRNGERGLTLRDLVRGPFFIPESKRVDELLGEFQERHIHMAIVVDEHGGVAGIITIEDLIEEIVGEIEDEFDTSEPTIERDELGQALVDARIEVDAFNAAFNATITGEGYETLGGFLYSQLGKIPSSGDMVIANGLQLEVLTTVGRRIKKVRVFQVRETEGGLEHSFGADQSAVP
jgi:putative hemolysin